MMVAITLRQHLDRHAEIAGGFPSVGALLHQPCRGSVAEGVGCHVWPKASVLDGRSEPLPDRPNRLAIPLNAEALPAPFPAPKVA